MEKIVNTKQEKYAGQLYQELQKKIPAKPNFFSRLLRLKKTPVITFSLSGEGTQWKCVVSGGTRQCVTSCLDIDRNDVKYKGAEYYTHFKLNGKTIAEGRTFHKNKTIEAIKLWMKNKTIEELYNQFNFVDEEKRQLEKIRTELVESNPREFESTKGEVITDHFSVSSLWFTHKDRSCRIYFYGYDPLPHYVFYWDDVNLFETFASGHTRLGSLVARWVFDKEIPSVLKKEFPEISFGLLADHHEKEKESLL